MNEANEFYEDMQSRKQTVINWRTDSSTDENADPRSSQGSGKGSGNGSGSGLGNGETKRNSDSATTKDGIPSQGEKDQNATPNG